MSVNAKFQAEFGSFLKGIEEADLKLADFGKGAADVEGKLNRMIDNFSGRKVIQEAQLMAEALDKVEGGLQGLTDKELERVGAKAAEAVEKLQRLGIEVPPGIQRIADATKKADEASSGWLQSLKGLGAEWVARIATGQILANVIESVVGAVKDLAMELPKIALEGAGFGDIEENFQHLTAEAGVLSDALMTTLRTATHNTVNDLALMTTVNKDLAAGLKLSQSEFQTMAQGAFALAQATGTDVKTAFDKMNEAMLTGRLRGVEELTGKINLAQAEETYAQKVGKTVDALTSTDKLWAAREAILNAVTASTARLGEQTDGLDEHVAQVSTAWENFRLELGKAIAQSPVLEAGFAGLKRALEEAFGGTSKTLIDNLKAAVDTFAIGLVDAADMSITVGSSIVSGMTEAVNIVRLMAQGVEAVGLAFVALERAKAQAGKALGLKGYAEEFEIMDKAYGDFLIRMNERNESMKALAQIDKKQAEISGQLHEALAKTKKAMEEARGAGEQYGPVTREVAAAADAAALAAGRKAEGMEGDSAATRKAAAEQEKYAAALAELAVAGQGWKGTLDSIDGAVAAAIQYYLEAGVSQSALATAYGLTATQVKAVASSLKDEQEALKAEQAGVDEAARLWSDYFRIRGEGGASALDKQKADIDAWANDLAAKMKKAGSDTQDFYNALGAVSSAKKDALLIDQNAIQQNSIKTQDEMAAKAQATYQYMLEHSEEFSAETIEKYRLIAEAATKTGKTIGDAIKDGADKGSEAIEKTKKAMEALATFSFAGGSKTPVGDYGALTTEQMMSMGLVDMYHNLTARGAQAGYGYGPLGGGTSFGGFRAGGGDVVGGSPYMVGERGPELFVPSGAGSILANGSGLSVVVNVNGSVLGNKDEIARVVGDAIMSRMRGQGYRLPA